jgi:hypothetical protein
MKAKSAPHHPCRRARDEHRDRANKITELNPTEMARLMRKNAEALFADLSGQAFKRGFES